MAKQLVKKDGMKLVTQIRIKNNLKYFSENEGKYEQKIQST